MNYMVKLNFILNNYLLFDKYLIYKINKNIKNI